MTPILQVEGAALGLPCPVTFKLEHTQVTGSFKVRGAFNTMLSKGVPPAGVVAASGGNHGAVVAYAATQLGSPSVIFVPKAIAKEEKLRRMRDFGGEVILTDGAVADCMAAYAAHAEATGALSVHPYDTFPTLAGQGTVAAEIEAQMGGIDTVLVSTGGGGLIGGVAAWFRDRVRVISVETEGTNTLERSLRDGPEINVQATGIAASSLGGPRLGGDVLRGGARPCGSSDRLARSGGFRRGQATMGRDAADRGTRCRGCAGRTHIGGLRPRTGRAGLHADLRRQCCG